MGGEGVNPFFLSFDLSLLCHLAVCKIEYIFTQPHFHLIFSYLVSPNCYGEYTAFSHNKRASRIFPYSILLAHLNTRKISSFGIAFWNWV